MADFDVIGADTMCAAVQSIDAVHGERVGADSFDFCAHPDQEVREVLYMRFAGRVPENRRAFRECRRAHRVLGTGHTRLVEKDVAPAQFLRGEHELPAGGERRAKLLEREEVCIETTASDDIAARWGLSARTSDVLLLAMP